MVCYKRLNFLGPEKGWVILGLLISGKHGISPGGILQGCTGLEGCLSVNKQTSMASYRLDSPVAARSDSLHEALYRLPPLAHDSANQHTVLCPFGSVPCCLFHLQCSCVGVQLCKGVIFLM